MADEIETPEPTEQETPEVSAPSEGSETEGGNPAWQPILEAVPTPFHEALKPHLQEWDRGVQKRFEEIHKQYEPFKRFRESQVDPGRLDLGLRLVDQIDNDPVAFYENMGQRFRAMGLIKEAQQAEQMADDAAEEQEQEQEFRDPRLDGFMQQLQEAKQQLEQEKAEAEADRQIETELQEVQKIHGKPLDEKLTRRLLNEARIMFDEAVQARRPTPTLVDAYNSLMETVTYVSQMKDPKAPPVIPASGGQPAPQPINQQSIANDAKARRAAAAGLIQRLHGG